MHKPSRSKVNDVTEIQEVKLGFDSHSRHITPNIVQQNTAHFPTNQIRTTKYTM